MSKPKTSELRFPSMGVIRRIAHERAAAAVSYPTPWALNVRLEDVLTKRLRGGSFTAIDAAIRPTEIIYRDRKLTFSPDGDNPNIVYSTRLGDHTNYDFSRDITDTLRATAFQLAEAGEVGDTVVALIPYKDASVLGFTATETWFMQGDPTIGGLRNVSREIGIIGPDAWCINHDTVYFLSSHGLYSISANGSGLKALSEDKIPEELTGVVDAECKLTYRHADRGVYIHLTNPHLEDPEEDAVVSWFYDTERDGFWPFDTNTTDSHLLIGPLHIGGPMSFGLIQTLHGIVAAGSSSVRWRIVPGNTAEEAAENGKAAITAALAGEEFDEYVAGEGVWDAGRSHTSWPRVRTVWAVLWLSATAIDESTPATWAYESIVMESIPFGRFRQ